MTTLKLRQNNACYNIHVIPLLAFTINLVILVCLCLYSLSESCSHVGAVLFAIEAGVKMRETASCTTEKCKWLMPSHVKKVFRPQWSVSCSCRPCLSHCYTAPTLLKMICWLNLTKSSHLVALTELSSVKLIQHVLSSLLHFNTLVDTTCSLLTQLHVSSYLD